MQIARNTSIASMATRRHSALLALALLLLAAARAATEGETPTAVAVDEGEEEDEEEEERLFVLPLTDGNFASVVDAGTVLVKFCASDEVGEYTTQSCMDVQDIPACGATLRGYGHD